MTPHLDRVLEAISGAFEIPVQSVNAESSSQTIEQWDSVGHINLVMALEQTFQTSFTMEEIAAMHDVATICSVLEQKSGKDKVA